MRHNYKQDICAALLTAVAGLIMSPTPAIADVWPSTAKRIVLAGSASPVAGETRIALVIGNAAYTGVGVQPLENPINDANAVGSTLQQEGFNVTLLTDASRDDIRDTVHAFAGQIMQSGGNTVALLYYSGHGMQVGGRNYLIPIGFTLPSNILDIDDYAYPVDKALGELQDARARVDVVILDACRDNPYDASKGFGAKGLAEMNKASGVYIAYATAAGQTADDDPASPNSLYTQELLRALATPGLNIHEMFQSVRRSVYQDSEGQQYPFDDDGLLSDDFYFAGRTPNERPVVTPTDTIASQANPAAGSTTTRPTQPDAEQGSSQTTPNDSNIFDDISGLLVELYGPRVDNTARIRKAFDDVFSGQDQEKLAGDKSYIKNYYRFTYWALPLHAEGFNQWFDESSPAAKREIFLGMKNAVLSDTFRELANPEMDKVDPAFEFTMIGDLTFNSPDIDKIMEMLQKKIGAARADNAPKTN
jgi:hypothetical protein